MKPEDGPYNRRQTKERRRQLTVDHVLDPAVAVIQRPLRIGPVQALSLKLGLEERFLVLQLLDLRLVLLRWVRRLLRKPVALLGRLAALLLLGVELGLELAHVCPQMSGGLCQNKKEISASTKNK